MIRVPTNAISALGRRVASAGTISRPAPFHSLETATKDEILEQTAQYNGFVERTQADYVLDLFKWQDGDHTKLGADVSLFEHGLQTATRAMEAGENEEMIVCCLLHDLGELMSPPNHGSVIASLLRPYISDMNYKTLDHHEIFQGHYYFHHVGADRNKRDMYKNEPWFDYCADFCHKYDQNSFDKNFVSAPLSTFEPMVHRLFARSAWEQDPTNPKAGAVLGAPEESA